MPSVQGGKHTTFSKITREMTLACLAPPMHIQHTDTIGDYVCESAASLRGSNLSEAEFMQ